MRIKNLIIPLLCLGVAGLSGCGGSGDGSPASTPSPVASSVITGMASKGPIHTGTIKVYAVHDGVADMMTPIGQGQTDGSGNYSVDIGTGHQGQPVIVEVTGGSYTDEVSGVTVVLKTPMHTAVSNAGPGSMTVAVTPLTELAYKKAKGSGKLTQDSINAANAMVGGTFSVNDIVSSLPIPGGPTDDQKKHAAACGTFSQLVNDNKGQEESLDDSLSRHLSHMGDEEEHNGGLSDDSVKMINVAIMVFKNGGKNGTGGDITPVTSPTDGVLKLTTTGGSLAIGAIDVIVNLPDGATVNADPATGETAAGVVSISGVASSGSNSLSISRFIPASGGHSQLHIALINTAGFGAGEFVKIKFDLTAGAAFPTTNDFTIADFSARALDGSTLSGVTAAPLSVTGM